MIKICQITTVHPAFDVRIFNKECLTLARSGFDVTLIAQHGKREEIQGVHIVPLPMIRGRVKRMLVLPIVAFYRALWQQADAYHFHDPELLPVGVLLKLFTFQKVIYDVHENYHAQALSKEYIPRMFRKIVALGISFCEKICTLFFDGIITATDGILNQFHTHKNVICIHNYPVLSNSDMDLTSFKCDNDVPFRLIYCGGIFEIRGIREVVKSLELLPKEQNIRLTLCGKFESSKFEEEIRSMNGFSRVDYLGWVNPDILSLLISASDVGIVCFHPEPNHIESMPNKIFEYMASAIPVIASGFPLWKEIIVENRAGICTNPLNPAAIAEGILYLYNNRTEAIAMGRNGKRMIQKSLHWDMEGERLSTFYKKMFIKTPTQLKCPMA